MAVIQDPFQGLINGVLQGHAIATHLRDQARQEELYQRALARDEREQALKDMEAQMTITGAGRPVVGNMVQQSFDTQFPGVAPGLPSTSQTVSFNRPVDRRRLLTYKTKAGDTIQSEAYTPEEQLQAALSHQTATKQYGAIADKQISDMLREYELSHSGVNLPPHITDPLGLPRGHRVTEKEAADFAKEAAAIRKQNRETVAPGATALDYSPQPQQEPFPGAPAPEDPTIAGMPAPDLEMGPLGAAAAATRQNRADFMDRARAAGQGPVQAPGSPRVLYVNPKPATEPAITKPLLAYIQSNDPDPQKRANADAAIQRLDKSALASRPVNNNIFQPPAGTAAAGKASIDAVPAEFRDQVQQVLDYRKPLPPNSRTNRTNQAINYWVSRIGAPDPATGDDGYDAALYPARAAYQRSLYGDGKVGQALVSLNTMINHVGTMWDAAEKLDNSSFKRYNNFANWLKAEAGSEQAKPFVIARLGVSEELAKLLKGGVATKEEVDNWMHALDTSDSPAQLRTAIKTVLELAHGRTTSLEEQHVKVMRRPPPDPFVWPRAQAILDRIGGTGQGEAPPLPARLSAADVGKTFTNGSNQKIRITAVNPQDGTKFRFEVQ